MRLYILFALLCGRLYSQKLDVYELLDSITDSLDYFIFNYKSWNQDLRFTLTILESETKRILDGYVKSELDFDLLYVPIIRRYHGQAQLLLGKIKSHFINEKNPKELLFHHSLFDSNWQTFLLYPHRISEKKLLWTNQDLKHKTPSNLNDHYECILDLLTPDICQNDDFLDDQHGACLKLMTTPPHIINNVFPFEIVNIQLMFSILVFKIGCGTVFEKELRIYGKNNFNWQSELCSNAEFYWSQNEGGLNSTLLKTEYSCLLLGFVNFLSKPRLNEILSHFTKDSSSYETTGCILTQSAQDFSNTLGQYVPFSHPFAYDFAYPLSAKYPFKPRAEDSLAPPLENSSSNKVCDPLLTNYALRILIMYMRFILDPGPSKFKAHWVEPEMYMEKTLNAIQYVPQDKTATATQIEEHDKKLDIESELGNIGIEELDKNGNKPEPDKLAFLPKMSLDKDEGAGYYIESLLKNPIAHSPTQGMQVQLATESGFDLDLHYLKASYLLIFGGLLCFLAFCLYRSYRKRKWRYRGLNPIFAFSKKLFANSKYAQRKFSTHEY